MSKLLYADFTRLKNSLFFWTCIIGMFALGTVFSAFPIISGQPVPLRSLFLVYTYSVPVLCALQNSLLSGAEYESGAIRCKLICGHKRVSIYLANVVVCTAAGLAATMAYVIPVIVSGCVKSELEASPKPLEALTCVMFISACVCLYALITVIIQKKLEAFVVCLLVLVPVLSIAVRLFDKIYNEYFFQGIYRTEIDISTMKISALVTALICAVFLYSGVKIFSEKDLK